MTRLLRLLVHAGTALAASGLPAGALAQPAVGRPAPADAPRSQSRLYGGAGASWLKEEETELGFASLLGGVRFGRHFAAEGELAIGFHDEVNEAGGMSDRLGIDFDLAAYGVGRLPVGGGVELFVRAGYGYTEFERHTVGPGFDETGYITDGSFRYGLGGQVFLDEANSLRATWTRWDEFQDGGIHANVFTASYVMVFE